MTQPQQIGFGFDEMLREQERVRLAAAMERATLISDGCSPKEALSSWICL